jgi:hypothetical protein
MLGRALGEESDGGHLTPKKRISVISIKYGVSFVISITLADCAKLPGSLLVNTLI